MLGLCCDETYGAMTNYGDWYDNGDNDGNKDGNDDNNSASGSLSYGLIFNLIIHPWSCRGLLVKSGYVDAAAM